MRWSWRSAAIGAGVFYLVAATVYLVSREQRGPINAEGADVVAPTPSER